MNEFKFTIYGEPVAKGRPKPTTIAGHAVMYTPTKTRKAENNLRAQALPFKPESPLTQPIHILMDIYVKMPKASKRKTSDMLSGLMRPAKRPDIDNYVKLVLDALNGIFYVDDNQVVELHARKWYSDTPRIEITIGDWQ